MTYTDFERVNHSEAVAMMEDGARVFYDDLGGGSEAIEAFRLPDGRHLVRCTGTGGWLIPAGVDAKAMCEAEAHGVYVAAGWDSPYADDDAE